MSNLNYWHNCLIFLIAAGLVAFSEQGVTKDLPEPYCRPPPNPAKPHYVIAYGSLLNPASKLKTYPETGEAIPVTINGFSRSWNSRSIGVGLGITYLGVVKNPSSNFNGIIFELKSADITAALQKFDRREEQYCRLPIEFNQLNFTAWNSSAEEVSQDGEFWIYVPRSEFTGKPSKEFPIVQSYVDTFLTGCLELETQFSLKDYAKQCVSTTQDWGFYWVNDRVYRRRPFVFVPKAPKIDALLAANVPKEYFNIVIE